MHTTTIIESSLTLCYFSFFWSLEFWGAARSYRSRPLFQGILMIGILIIGGIMALLAGPATAILMIPREMPWPAGGAIFWLNGKPRSPTTNET